MLRPPTSMSVKWCGRKVSSPAQALSQNYPSSFGWSEELRGRELFFLQLCRKLSSSSALCQSVCTSTAIDSPFLCCGFYANLLLYLVCTVLLKKNKIDISRWEETQWFSRIELNFFFTNAVFWNSLLVYYIKQQQHTYPRILYLLSAYGQWQW